MPIRHLKQKDTAHLNERMIKQKKSKEGPHKTQNWELKTIMKEKVWPRKDNFTLSLISIRRNDKGKKTLHVIS